MEREDLEMLCDRGLTQRAIAEWFGVSHATARYWLKQYGLSTNGRRTAKRWDSVEFATACVESLTVAEVLDRIGVSKCSGNYRRAMLMAKQLGVELPVAKRGAWHSRIAKPMLTDEQVRGMIQPL
jgi:orotate phosphoribosyltransferase-like protein